MLLDHGWECTLYVAAGLARAGAHVVLATEASYDSRLVANFADVVALPSPAQPTFARTVIGLAERYESDLIFPTSDDLLRTMWTADEDRLGRVWPPTEPWQRALVHNRRRLLDHVAEAGVRILEHRTLASYDDVGPAVRDLGLPVVVKGMRGFGGNQVRIVERDGSVAAAVHEVRRISGEWPMIERYVDGPTFLVGALLHEGRALRLYAAEKLEQSPARTGPSIRLRSCRDDDLLWQATRAFASLRWTGLASADLIRDRDGRFHFLEFNPRPWGAIGGAAAAGVDFFPPLVELLSGAAPEAALSFRDAVESVLFPQYWKIRLREHGPRSLLRAETLRHLPHAVPWREPALAAFFAALVGREWGGGILRRLGLRTPRHRPAPVRPLEAPAHAAHASRASIVNP